MPKPKERIRALKFKVLEVDDETAGRWRYLANQCKRLRNSIWRHWLAIHTNAESDRELATYMQDMIVWNSSNPKTRGPRPQCKVKCVTNEMKQQIRSRLLQTFHDLNERPFALTLDKELRQIQKMAADQSAFPRWMRVLVDEESIPTSSRPYSVPFSKRNATVIPPASEHDNFRIKLRLDRYEEDGRKIATSHEDIFPIKTAKKRKKGETNPETNGFSGKVQMLWQIVNGHWDFSGSNLHYNPTTREWFVSINYQVPEESKPALSGDKVAFLRAAINKPWWLRIDGFNTFMGGRHGRHVAHTRSSLLTQRWSRQESYQHASSARRGHGRKRAFGKVHLLKGRWQDFVRTANEKLVKDVIEKLVDVGAGRLIYFQPVGRFKDRRFLQRVGKSSDRDDSSGWDWFQVTRMLREACEQKGIAFEARKAGTNPKQR